MKDNYKTTVIFRKFKDGDIIALFPYETHRYQTTDYMHIGQHGHSDYSLVISITKKATPEEYNDLKKELEQIGYDLKVNLKANWGKMYACKNQN